MKRLLWMLMILFLTGCSSAPSLQEMKAADPPKDDKLIVPGWRVGKVYLGMTSAALFAAMGEMGEPDSTASHVKYGSFSWKYGKHDGLEVMLDKKTDQVYALLLHNGSYKTAEGVQMGMSELAVVVKLGKPDSQRSDNSGKTEGVCYKRGITVLFDDKNKVYHMQVLPSKEWRGLCR